MPRSPRAVTTSPERLRDEQVTSAALQLRVEGHDWETVAARLGITTAHNARMRVAKRVQKVRQQDVETMREVQTRRYERLLLKLEKRLAVPTPSYHALAEARAILARIDVIWGLARLPAALEHGAADGEVRTTTRVTVEEQVEVGAGLLELMAALGIGQTEEEAPVEAEAEEEVVPVSEGMDLLIRRLGAENARDGHEDDGYGVG